SARSAPSRIATSCAPVAIAAALPRLDLCRTTRAPAPIATAEVASVEPSSTTTTRSTPGIRRAEKMVASIRSASFLAGITTATRSGRCAVSGPAVSSQRHLPCHDPAAGPALERGQRFGGGQRLLEAAAERLGLGLDAGRAVPLGQVPHRDGEALRTEGADVLGALAEGGLAARVQARDRVDHRLLVGVGHPAKMLLGAGVDPVAVRQALHRPGGHDRLVRLGDRLLD